jgi:hypothetical protein
MSTFQRFVVQVSYDTIKGNAQVLFPLDVNRESAL